MTVKELALGFWFHERMAHGDSPAGYTVSRDRVLPAGGFRITCHQWPDVELWFLDSDRFTADEREACARAFRREFLRRSL